MKNTDANSGEAAPKKTLANILSIIKTPSVWMLMIIVMCAYVGYKLTDIFSLYANEVMFYDEVEAAQIGTMQLYLRPIVCIAIGLLADKTRASLWMIIGFIIMMFGAFVFASGYIAPGLNTLFMLSLIVTATGTYAVRTLYFAALQEGRIPLAITGTAVGAISVIGYTPDIFVGPIMGYLLDHSPGELGHQHVFVMLSIFAFIGLLAAIGFRRITNQSIQLSA